nr:MAG TPA: hypothetical protein [Microviridae sp.]
MTKNKIIRLLQKLAPCRIKSLELIYHKLTPNGSAWYKYNYTSMSEFFSTPLVEVLLSLYRLRGNIRAIHLVYFDNQGQKQELRYLADDCKFCDNLSDFINY